MRNLIYLIIFSLSLSGIANAAMVCCWDMSDPSDQVDERSGDIERKPSCHETLFDDVGANGQTPEAAETDISLSSCECETACYKSSHVDHVKVHTFLQSHSFVTPYVEHFLNVPHDSIEHPPKHLL